MAPVRHDPLAQRPGIDRALRWLRHRRRLTQAELREAVVAGGQGLSVIYIQQLEAGRKRPSPAMLDALLVALSSTREELTRLCDTEPWQVTPPGGWRPSRHDPVRAADPASRTEGTWSDAVALAGAPPDGAAAGGAHRGDASAAEGLEAELAELAGIYRSLTPAERHELLEAARHAGPRPGG